MYILLIITLLSPVRAHVPEPRKAMLYSAVFPGGGQFYTGNYIKGIMFGGAEIFLLASSYVNYRESLRYSPSTYQRDFYGRESFSYALYFLGVYLFSIADAYVSANFHRVKDYFHTGRGRKYEKVR